MEINNRQPADLLIEAEQRLSWFQRDVDHLTEHGFVRLMIDKAGSIAIKDIQSRIDSMINFINKYDGTDTQGRIISLESMRKDIGSLRKEIDILALSHDDAIATQNKTQSKEIKKKFMLCKQQVSEMVISVDAIAKETTDRIRKMRDGVAKEDLCTSVYGVEQQKEKMKQGQVEAFEKKKNVWSENIEQCVFYIELQEWDRKTRGFFLQLLFWKVYSESDYAKAKNKKDKEKFEDQFKEDLNLCRKALRKIKVPIPHIIHNYGEEPVPQFICCIDEIQISNDIPMDLQDLLNKLKEREIINPYLGLEAWYNRIEKRELFFNNELGSFVGNETISAIKERVLNSLLWVEAIFSQEESEQQKEDRIQIEANKILLVQGKKPKKHDTRLSLEELARRKECRKKALKKKQ